MTRTLTRLTRAMDRSNALFLEEIEPELYAAIDAELADGATVDDVTRTIADMSSPTFARIVRSAARWLDGVRSQT